MRKIGVAVVCAIFAESVPVHALDRDVERKTDPFTDEQVCRVNYGSGFARAFTEGLAEGVLGWYGLSYFFAERRNGQIIAGITNDQRLPIAGDIQIRVDDGPVTTIAPSDTPENLLPPLNVPVASTGYPNVDQQIAQTMRNARAQMLPFRIISGDKAKALLRSIVSRHRAIWRSVAMIAAADRGPAEIKIEGLSEALQECGIDLTGDTQSPAPTGSATSPPMSQPR